MSKKLSLPRIHRTISSFMLEEEGKISKQSLIKLGVLVGGISVMAKMANAAHSQNVAHSQAVNVGYAAQTVTITHSHYDPAHSSHSSHSSHGSHASHSAHASHSSHTSGGCYIPRFQ